MYIRYVYIYTHINTHCIYIYIYLNTHTHCIYIYICTHTVRIYIYNIRSVYVYKYIHIFIYIHTVTVYIYIYMYLLCIDLVDCILNVCILVGQYPYSLMFIPWWNSRSHPFEEVLAPDKDKICNVSRG